MTKAMVMVANTARPRCPNQVSAATAVTTRTAKGMRHGASAGIYAMTADAAAETLIAIVRTKSTMSAPIGMNAQPSPKAAPAAAAAPRPRGIARPVGGSW